MRQEKRKLEALEAYGDLALGKIDEYNA